MSLIQRIIIHIRNLVKSNIFFKFILVSKLILLRPSINAIQIGVHGFSNAPKMLSSIAILGMLVLVCEGLPWEILLPWFKKCYKMWYWIIILSKIKDLKNAFSFNFNIYLLSKRENRQQNIFSIDAGNKTVGNTTCV